jgi:hypothetical protein
LHVDSSQFRTSETHQIVTSDRIRSVTASGILYIDDHGRFEFVDLEACYQRWFDWQYTDRNRTPDRDRSVREVGARDADPDSLFIEFYTEPHTRFTFDSYEELCAFRLRMWKLGGFDTYDLT